MFFSMSNLLIGQQDYINYNTKSGIKFTPKSINKKSYSLHKSGIKYHYLHYYSPFSTRAIVNNIAIMPISVSSINKKHFKLAKPNSIALYDFTRNSYRYSKFSSKLNFDINSALMRNKPYSTYTNIDSFNPYGASNFEEAICLGLFNSLFKLGR